MSSMTSFPSAERQRSEFGRDELLLDYRQRRALEAFERAELKRRDHAEQYATGSPADQRIRAWEKVHQLRMPSAPLHPVLEAIAVATQLTLAEVHREQQLRSGRSASAEL